METESGSRSVHAFIDKKTGEVYKPASFKAPAKHVRYNLLSEISREECYARCDWAGGYCLHCMIMAKESNEGDSCDHGTQWVQLSRETKHYIWKHHTGVVMTTSKTPSDNYATAQITRQIRRTLGEVV